MGNLILHFGENANQKNIYNLIVKMTNVPTDQQEFHRDDLQSKNFEITAIVHNLIVLKFSQEYIVMVKVLEEFENEGSLV